MKTMNRKTLALTTIILATSYFLPQQSQAERIKMNMPLTTSTYTTTQKEEPLKQEKNQLPLAGLILTGVLGTAYLGKKYILPAINKVK